MKISIKPIFLIAAFCVSISSWAQDSTQIKDYTFTLEEAIHYGLENSYNSQIAQFVNYSCFPVHNV